MLESGEKEIDGMVFKVQQLPAMRSVKELHKLTRVVGPALVRMVGDVKGAAKLSDLDLSGLPDAAQSFFDRFSEDDLERLCRTFFESATVVYEGRELPLMPSFDLVMRGKPFTVLKVLWFALNVNYGNFSDALSANLTKLVGQMQAKSGLKESTISSPSGPVSG